MKDSFDLSVSPKRESNFSYGDLVLEIDKFDKMYILNWKKSFRPSKLSFGWGHAAVDQTYYLRRSVLVWCGENFLFYPCTGTYRGGKVKVALRTSSFLFALWHFPITEHPTPLPRYLAYRSDRFAAGQLQECIVLFSDWRPVWGGARGGQQQLQSFASGISSTVLRALAMAGQTRSSTSAGLVLSSGEIRRASKILHWTLMVSPLFIF